MFGVVLRGSSIIGALWLAALTILIGLRPAEPLPLLLTAQMGVNAFTWHLRDPADGRAFTLIPQDTINVNWSPDGGWILYTQFEEGPFNQPRARNLTTGADFPLNFDAYNALWSPDGRWLIYFHTGGDTAYAARVTADSIEPGGELLPVNNALWSPDSRFVYYLYYPPWDGQIARVDVACLEAGGCERQNIPAGEFRIDGLFGWTPDGQIMVNSLDVATPNQPPRLYALDLDSGAMRLLLDNPLPGVNPAWSPDGALLAMTLLDVVSDMPGTEPIPALHLIDGATGEQTALWAGVVGQIEWSPDGRWLVFEVVERTGGRRSVWLYERSGGAVRSLTPFGGFEASPQWGVYHGRRFDGWLPLGGIGAALACLWFTRRRV